MTSRPRRLPSSFGTAEDVGRGPAGQLAHRSAIAHNGRFAERLYTVGDGPGGRVWVLVGNGLSNQVFIDAPDGIIAVDTGECNEEMEVAIGHLREVTDRPIVAVLYSHSHYVAGTAAIVAERRTQQSGTGVADPDELPIWGHAKIVANRLNNNGTMNAVAGRGLVHQFGLLLPREGDDALLGAGLGPWFRNPHLPSFTPGFIPPTNTFDAPTAATVAGLEITFIPAPSDADDSALIWIPTLSTLINNNVWPTLFNVFPIRGEEFRDPRVLLQGLDTMIGLAPEHLVGVHGPPVDGADQIRQIMTKYRDAIQFLCDQTIRGINRGLTYNELTDFVQLPNEYGDTYFTEQQYGLVEHYVKQIHSGLRGWFDGDESTLFPLRTDDRFQRLIEGFGGRDEVRRQAEAALADDDVRWALELATWLVRSEIGPDGRADGGSVEDRRLLASVLRTIGQRTTAANLRNWTLTRALELDGELDLSRFRVHRFPPGEVMSAPADAFVRVLPVVLAPERAAGVTGSLAWHFDDGTYVGIRMRNSVAIVLDAAVCADADATIALSLTTWAQLLANKVTLHDVIASGDVVVTGDSSLAGAILNAFDVPALQTPI